MRAVAAVVVSVGVALTGLTGASPAGAQSTSLEAEMGSEQERMQALEDVVRARELAFAGSMADRDLEAFRSFVSEEAVFFAGNRPTRGRDPIVEAWAPFFEGPNAPFSWEPDVVTVLESGRLALSSGPVTSAAGEEAGRFNSIWRLEEDGVWRVVFDKGS